MFCKAKQKLSALSRMAKLLSFNKRRTLSKAFVESQFKYSPIVGCFIVDVPTSKLMSYIRTSLELFMMTTSQLLINYLTWADLSVFTIKISRDTCKTLHDISVNSLKEEVP